MIAHSRYADPQRQQGAVILTVCLLLLFLLGFVAIAFDLGRLFIVKTELQTAMDSCALAAAQELDGQPGALTRARRAGTTAANLNRVNLQSADWDGKGQMLDAGISFRDAAYLPTTAPAQVAFAIPKRYMKLAVQRNRMRRLLREAYRLNKHTYHDRLRTAGKQCAWLFVYQGKAPLTLAETQQRITRSLDRWMKQHG